MAVESGKYTFFERRRFGVFMRPWFAFGAYIDAYRLTHRLVSFDTMRMDSGRIVWIYSGKLCVWIELGCEQTPPQTVGERGVW